MCLCVGCDLLCDVVRCVFVCFVCMCCVRAFCVMYGAMVHGVSSGVVVCMCCC